jgi:hypothetical protein
MRARSVTQAVRPPRKGFADWCFAWRLRMGIGATENLGGSRQSRPGCCAGTITKILKEHGRNLHRSGIEDHLEGVSVQALGCDCGC